jgi:hypoxanthine phosphoribosyltransferase
MLGRKVIDRSEIGEALTRLGGEIDQVLEGRPAVFIGVLKGCVYFFTDLTRCVSSPIAVDFIQVSSYGSGTSSSGSVVLVKDITIDVRDREVFLVEDIVDTGTTLADVIELIQARHPRSLHVVSLLSKPSRREVAVPIDHLGMEIDDVFVVGYGLDFDERYRNLPDIWELQPGAGDGGVTS